jgi:hypothetical protein
VRNRNKSQIDKHGLSINKTNLYSLTAIASTTVVTAYFLYNLFFINPKPDTGTETLNTNSKTILFDSLKSTVDTLKIDLDSTLQDDKKVTDSIK